VRLDILAIAQLRQRRGPIAAVTHDVAIDDLLHRPTRQIRYDERPIAAPCVRRGRPTDRDMDPCDQCAHTRI